MSRVDDHAPSSLPLWIAVACCVAATLLVFGNAIPALQERDDLQRIDAGLADRMRGHEADIRMARLSGAQGNEALELDLQSVIVAIDQKGLTVAEFCAEHRAEDETTSGGPGSINRDR